MADWRCKFEGTLGLKVLEVTGDTEVSETADLDAADIICTTPEKFGELCACWSVHEPESTTSDWLPLLDIPSL